VKNKKWSGFVKSRTAWSSLAFLVLIAAYFTYTHTYLSRQEDVFRLLENKGYTPNAGFSGLFRPGNLIQVTEQEADGKEHPIAAPVLFAWSDECFPGQVPRTQEFTIPQGTGSVSTSLNIGREAATRLMPSLKFGSEAVADYSLKLENTRVQAFAKGDLSGRFSAQCVEKLKRAIRAGDKIQWFQLILASVVADAVTIQVRWKETTSADARLQLIQDAKSALEKAATPGVPSDGSGVHVGITNNSSKETTISGAGLLIIGYQSRPIQPETTSAAVPGAQ
jgi:hypothetical protein